MSAIAEFTISADAFALQRTFETLPGVTIEVERLATHSREWIMPFTWTTGEPTEDVDRVLRRDPSIEAVQEIGADGDTGQFMVEWEEGVQQLVDQIVNQHGIVQEAAAADGTWYLKLKFVDRESIAEFQESFHERGHEFELQRLYDATAPKEREYDLTPEQREALIVAQENGYFSVPREAGIEDVAAELGVSPNAVSERLRRATGDLTRNTLLVTPPADQIGTE